MSENALVIVELVSLTDGKKYVFQAQSNANGDWSIPADQALPEGQYQINITAKDAAGNISDVLQSDTNLTIDKTVDVSVDAGLTGSSDTGTEDDDITKLETVTIHGTVEPGQVTITALNGPNGQSFLDQLINAEIYADENGVWQQTSYFESRDGVYSYTVSYESGNDRKRT